MVQWTYGQIEEGVAEARRALDRDPLSSSALTIFAIALAMAGKGDEAVATARRSIEADPDSYLALWALGQAHAWSGQPEAAVTTHQQGAEKAKSPFSLSPLASALARAGRREDALAIHEELTARATGGYVAPAFLALSCTATARLITTRSRSPRRPGQPAIPFSISRGTIPITSGTVVSPNSRRY